MKLLDLNGNVVGTLDLNEEQIKEFFGDEDDVHREFMEFVEHAELNPPHVNWGAWAGDLDLDEILKKRQGGFFKKQEELKNINL